jgi:hypothetical protein
MGLTPPPLRRIPENRDPCCRCPIELPMEYAPLIFRVVADEASIRAISFYIPDPKTEPSPASRPTLIGRSMILCRPDPPETHSLTPTEVRNLSVTCHRLKERNRLLCAIMAALIGTLLGVLFRVFFSL